MDIIVIVLILLVLFVMFFGIIYKSRDSFFIKYYGLENYKNKYLIQNILNFIFCTVTLLMAYIVYFYSIDYYLLVIVPLIIHLTNYILKKFIK